MFKMFPPKIAAFILQLLNYFYFTSQHRSEEAGYQGRRKALLLLKRKEKRSKTEKACRLRIELKAVLIRAADVLLMFQFCFLVPIMLMLSLTSRPTIRRSCASCGEMSSNSLTALTRYVGGVVVMDVRATSPLSTSSLFTNDSDPK
ncbi:hypothetical protein CHARACLAT_022665 [Characodon lateralis]|uniref:Uncharacterized protein n=1 Tax=Characodon lateralis TaxID=208331 RepID=A0ABU7E3E3_9TELE|nr:hypothetical protein [Characodon lateralis]